MRFLSKSLSSFISIAGIIMSPGCAAEPVDGNIHCQMNGVELSIPKALLFGPATLTEQDENRKPPQTFPHISQFGFSLDPISYQPIGMATSMDIRNQLPRFKEELVKIPILVSVMNLAKNRPDIGAIPRRSYEDLASVEFPGKDPYGNIDNKTEMYKIDRNVEINKSNNDAIYLSHDGSLLVTCERLTQFVPPYADISQCHGVFVFPRLGSSVGFYFSRVDIENVANIKDAIFRALSVFIVSRGGSRG